MESFQYPDHLFFYGQRSLVELLDRTGFDHVCTYRYSIRPEQLLAKQVRKVLGRSGHGQSAEPSAVDTRPPVRTSRAGHVARDALNLTYSALRFTAGRLAIHDDVPQTLVVVARKAE